MRRAFFVLASVACALALAAPSRAQSTLTFAGTGGLSRADASRARYRWDERAHAAYGASALLSRGRVGAGVRVERTGAAQALELGGSAPAEAAITGTSLEAIARVRVARVSGASLALTGAAGRTWYAWTPEQVDVNTGSGVTTVRFAPVATPSAAVGAVCALSAGRWQLGLAAERRFVTLDTAHRAGEQIVYAKETFGDWNARLEVARTFALGAEGRTR